MYIVKQQRGQENVITVKLVYVSERPSGMKDMVERDWMCGSL